MKLLSVLILTSAALAQQTCPIEVLKVNPHSLPVLAGNSDPWDHYIRIEYRNASPKTITAIRFQARFYGSLGASEASVFAYTDDTIKLAPGKSSKPYWGDGVYFNQYGYKMSASVWADRIGFSDGSTFVDDGSKLCEFPKLGMSNMLRNSTDSASSPAAIAAGPQKSPEELRELIKQGKASILSVVTVPPGAEVDVDGKKIGISPLAFFLLKKDDARTIDIRLAGYKPVKREIVPDGNQISLGLPLEKQ